MKVKGVFHVEDTASGGEGKESLVENRGKLSIEGTGEVRKRLA